MAKPLPARPTGDFKITTFAWSVDSEATHGKAGFPRIPDDVLRRRFFQFLCFLQVKGMTARTVAETVGAINLAAEIRNSDLTDQGYRFVQRFHDRWVARTYKDTGEAGEQKFLEKWHAQMAAESSDA